jgi:hypothetical protein
MEEQEAPTKKQRLVVDIQDDDEINWRCIAKQLVEMLSDNCKFSTKQCRACKYYFHEDEDGYTCTGDCHEFLCEECVTFDDSVHDLETLMCSDCKLKSDFIPFK